MSSGADEINSSTEDGCDGGEVQYSAIQIDEGSEPARIAIFNEGNADEWVEANASATFDLEVMR